MTLRFLVAESEPAEARERRRESVGRSSGESFQDVLREIATGAHMLRVAPADAGAALPGGKGLSEFDAIFLTGSPLHLYQDTPEARRTVEFMRGVFASRTPAFGSCAGLQVATVAAGGAVRRAANGREAGFARRIYPTPAGATHPMLAGRPPAFDALSVHTDEVATLPEDAVLLAANAMTAVQAAEIRFLAVSSLNATWDVIRGGYGPDVRHIDAALARVPEFASVDPRRVAIAGFSDGASYALSLGLINGDLVRDVLAFSPAFVAPGTPKGRPRVFISHGTHDDVLPVDRCSRRIVAGLKQAEYAVDYFEFDGGHSVPPEAVERGLLHVSAGDAGPMQG